MSDLPPHVVTSGEFARALGVDRRTLKRWEDRGTLPAPGRTDGGHARWSVAVAAEELLRRGITVPESWGYQRSQAA